jgi:gas vesicle protein
MNERTEYLTWLCCFLAGGIAGASTALLLVPEVRRETRGRGRVGRRLRRAARAARELGNRVVSPDPVLAGNGRPEVKAREDVAPSA